jgi:ATP-binding protein involved in chromosome partitioning
METTALREFIGDVAWGPLEYLLVDVPPGTDKIRRLLELVPDLPLALLVATPSEMSRAVVARSLRMVRDAGVPEVGIVGNMTEHVCRACGQTDPIFPGNGVERLSAESGVPVWGRIPFDSRMGASTDRGVPWVVEDPDGPVAHAFMELARRVGEARPSAPATPPLEGQ